MTATAPSLAAQVLDGWLSDLGTYSREALRIQTKSDDIAPMVLNPMQVRLHAMLEEQLRTTGRVRAIILKARQLGCSTYVAARFFHKVHLSLNGKRAYLLAHEDDACKKLVAMYRVMYDNHPEALRRLRPKSNDHGFELSNGGGLESDTASTPEGGRGGTKTLFHGSEVAFWRHYSAHSMGSMQQVSKLPGSEMILESTPNGPVGGFYERWRTAEAGRGAFLPVFFPWTVDPQYVEEGVFEPSREAPNEIVLSEYDYQQRYGVTDAQMLWRRGVVQGFDDDGTDGALKFTQEYPITALEAFLSVAGSSLLSPAQVEAARVRSSVVGAHEMGPLVLGLDPAPGHSSSASALAFRKGSTCYRMDRKHGLDAFALADYVYREFVDEGAERLCIDCTEGTGRAVYEELQRRPATGGRTFAVVFGARASDRTRWYNLRAEIWQKMASWIADGGSIPDERGESGQTLASELLSVHTKSGSERVVQLESKDDVIKRLGRSPDGADALACTFALPDPTGYSGHFQATADGVERHAAQRAPMSRRARHRQGMGGNFNALRR